MFNWKPLGINRQGKIMDTSNRDGADPEILIPVNPKPDLSTKPVDKVGYAFGYVCSKKHVNDTFDSITVEGYNIRKPCQTCGLLARPAIIKQTAEAKWVQGYGHSPTSISDLRTSLNWVWKQCHYRNGKVCPLWTKKEFVRFLTTKGGTI